MNVFITGGCGFIGSHLAERMVGRGDSVTILDDLSTGSMDNVAHLVGRPGFHHRIGSALDRPLVAELVDRADVTIHLAAAVGVRLIVERPVHTIETNVGATEAVLAAATRNHKLVVIAGDGEYGAELRAQASGMPNVRFVGRLPSDELSQFYRNSIATIVPSVCYETFGIVLIEAFRQGAPVIARRLGPFPEIVERSGGGELFHTIEELVLAMQRLQGDPAHRARLARAGFRGYVERWSESAVIPQYLEIVRRAAARRGHRAVLEVLHEAVVA